MAHLSKPEGFSLSSFHPVDAHTQAVLFNAVPLLVLAALYLGVGVALAPAYWRERRRLREVGSATALLYPCLGVALAIFGVGVLIEREPLGGHVWYSAPALLLAAVPLLALLVGWRDRESLISAVGRARDAERRTSLRDQELDAMGRLSRALLDAEDEVDIARLVLDELAELFDLEVANLSLIEPGAGFARIVGARDRRRENDRLVGQVVDLKNELSGISTVVRDGVAFAVFDVDASPIVNKRLNAIAQVKSCAFVPVFASDRVIGVVFAGVRRPRLFTEEELAHMQGFASEAGLALARARSARQLGEALDRERLVSRISLEFRSRQDLVELLRVAVEETGRAMGVTRCYVRLGQEDGAVQAEWDAPGVEPVGDTSRLPVVNLAVREGRTIAVADVLQEERLRDPALGEVDELVARGARAVLAVPIIAFDTVIGVLGMHRPDPGPWTHAEVSLAEAVTREAASAIHMRRLLRDSERRLTEQRSLLKAGEALTSDLRFDSVIDRLVDEMRGLVDADAAYCWTVSPSGDALVCRAVLGLPESEVGRRIPLEGAIGEAIASGKAVLKREFATTEEPPPSDQYAEFSEVMNAPIVSFGETRGVLGVCTRESNRFDESDLHLIEGFASLASIALRNAEAFEGSTRRAKIESGFYRIASVLSEPLSAAATLDAVAQAAAEALGGDFAAVLRMGSGELSLSGGHDLPEGLSTFFQSKTEGELAAAARAGKVLAARVLRNDTRFGSGLLAAAEGAGARSLLAVPLAQPRSDVGGLVLVFYREERAFTDEQLELAGNVAGAARGALERSELYELERRARSLAQRLARSSVLLASELDPDAVLDEVARLSIGLLEASGASARVFEDDELVILAAEGNGAEAALGARSASTAWLIGDIVGSRSARAIADVGGDPRAAEADPMLASGNAAFLGVPMIGPEGGVQGVLAVYDFLPREWREEEIEALEALAGNAAAARVNARLYQGVKHEQQRSEAILANVADGIVAVDREGKVVLWNPAAEQITGVPARDALGRTTLQALGRSLESDGTGSIGSRLIAVRRGGDEAWLSLSEAVMTDPAGGVAGRIFAFRDISIERAVEQMKSDFVSTVSHELRTPLTSIYGFAETLLRQDVLFGETERETFLRYIASESERLTAIVDRLLSVAQLDTGAITVQLAETDVGQIVSEAVHSAETALGDNGHHFVVSLAEGPLAAEADRDKLGQVLSHLLDNAVRYSPAGGTVTVAARRTDSAVEVRVEDEGVGIPRAEQERIFRKFYRGEAASRTVGAGATGLGLFLAEGLVTAMGGRIWVDSDEGRGSTFVLELPVGRA